MDSEHPEDLLSDSGCAVRFSGLSLARVPGSVLDLNGVGANRAALRSANAGAPPMGYCYTLGLAAEDNHDTTTVGVKR